jgi:predicted AlkP superfamily pyrophosphatase or phosphodiesterase
VVGLTPALLGPFTPRLSAFAHAGKTVPVKPVIPAVTATVDATYLTGKWPAEHGAVANGWYVRDEGEVRFWPQSNKLLQAPKIWEIARQAESSFTCADLCWWFNMCSSADYTVTPRPMYPADGRKIPDCYTRPAPLRNRLQHALGQFPLFQYWGPATSIRASKWIADAARKVDDWYGPTLSLIYLPHLDYCLQRRGPNPDAIAKDLRGIDEICGSLIDFFEARHARVIVLSEYGVTAVSRPVHINRVLRQHGYIAVRQELGRELLDPSECTAFAVVDHQIAHVYVNDLSKIDDVRTLLESTPGVGKVLGEKEKKNWHLDHPRSGDLVCLAAPDSWFTYYYWLDDSRCPDFARTVEIHRKPGYDPAELFIDPKLAFAQLRVAWYLMKKKLGFRALMEVIGLDATLVKGSHGLPAPSDAQGPLLITRSPQLIPGPSLGATDVMGVILRHLDIQPKQP